MRGRGYGSALMHHALAICDRDTTGLFTGITASPHESLLLQGAVRYDDPEDFDSETSWQGGARFSPLDVVTLAANWGESYKLPSFFALGQESFGEEIMRALVDIALTLLVAYVAWGAVHGLASLLIEGQILAAVDVDALIEETTGTLLDGMRVRHPQGAL